MSATGNPTQVVWVIRPNPNDESSIFMMPVENHQLGVFLLTQRDQAEEFARSYPDMPTCASISYVEVRNLAGVLKKQAKCGATHVVTNPIIGPERYLNQQTLAITDYINRLTG